MAITCIKINSCRELLSPYFERGLCQCCYSWEPEVMTDIPRLYEPVYETPQAAGLPPIHKQLNALQGEVKYLAKRLNQYETKKTGTKYA